MSADPVEVAAPSAEWVPTAPLFEGERFKVAMAQSAELPTSSSHPELAGYTSFESMSACSDAPAVDAMGEGEGFVEEEEPPERPTGTRESTFGADWDDDKLLSSARFADPYDCTPLLHACEDLSAESRRELLKAVTTESNADATVLTSVHGVGGNGDVPPGQVTLLLENKKQLFSGGGVTMPALEVVPGTCCVASIHRLAVPRLRACCFVGDTILAIGGQSLDSGDLDKAIARLPSDTPIELVLFQPALFALLRMLNLGHLPSSHTEELRSHVVPRERIQLSLWVQLTS
ncbi:MAG: hypothetical protein SGPRY_007418, partial [Prymnesium sp.]